jgi:hypothetical protein
MWRSLDSAQRHLDVIVRTKPKLDSTNPDDYFDVNEACAVNSGHGDRSTAGRVRLRLCGDDNTRTSDEVLRFNAVRAAWASWPGLLQDHANDARSVRATLSRTAVSLQFDDPGGGAFSTRCFGFDTSGAHHQRHFSRASDFLAADGFPTANLNLTFNR